jgi:hypothetical protein
LKYNKKTISIVIFFLFFSLTIGFPPSEAATFVLEDKIISYEIEGGSVTNMSLDRNFIELIVEMDTTDDGILQLSIPRTLLDAKFEDTDDIFFVIVNGFQTDPVEITSDAADSRTIIIPFFKGDTQVEIIGTNILDEGLVDIISETEVEIPSWVKNNAGWWADNLIGDSDFVSGIQYLITEGIMTIPPTQSGSSTSQEIPTWIKNNAGWWANNLITDTDFVSGIQYLITNGIMSV